MQNYRASWAEAKGAVGPTAHSTQLNSTQSRSVRQSVQLQCSPSHTTLSRHTRAPVHPQLFGYSLFGYSYSTVPIPNSQVPRGLPAQAIMIYLHQQVTVLGPKTQIIILPSLHNQPLIILSLCLTSPYYPFFFFSFFQIFLVLMMILDTLSLDQTLDPSQGTDDRI